MGQRQSERGAQRKNYLVSVKVGLDARSLRRRRKGEAHFSPKNNGISVADRVAGYRLNHLRFDEKCHGVGPVAYRSFNNTAAARKLIRLNFGKGTRPSDTRDPCIPVFMAVPSIQRQTAYRRLPFTVRRTRRG